MRPHAKDGTRISILLSAASLCLVCAGCGSQPEQTRPPAPAAASVSSAAEPQRYEMTGKVLAVDKPGKKVTVDHADIPGFMGAMAMPYPVKDETLLEKLSAGDQITAKVVSSGGEYWLEAIAVTGSATMQK